MAHARRGINLRQFAERRGCHGRSLYRDVAALRAAGVPVEHNEHGWFSVPASWIPAGTLDVKRDELLALFITRRFAPGLKDTSIGRSLDNLWSKLSTPRPQQMLALDHEAWIDARPMGSIDYSSHQLVLDQIRDAIRRRCALRIHYRKPDGVESRRVIEPVSVRWEPSVEGLYVFAWCRTREELRTFALHRVLSATPTAEAFVPRRDALAAVANAFRLWARATVEHVRLWFSPRVAGEVRERRWHATACMIDTLDGGVQLTMDVAAPAELERLLLGFGADVRVEAPASLATRVRERHAEALGPRRLGALRATRVRRPAAAASRQRSRSRV